MRWTMGMVAGWVGRGRWEGTGRQWYLNWTVFRGVVTEMVYAIPVAPAVYTIKHVMYENREY